jgi:hypothetical protein
MNDRIIYIVFMLLLFTGCRKSDYFLDNGSGAISDNGTGTGTVTWTKDKKYVLEGFVFVNDGQTLTIEAGTVIRFKPGKGENASALIVARGGKIIAEGTAKDPIIFTAEDDDLILSVPKSERGLWGGLIILGNAPLTCRAAKLPSTGFPMPNPRDFGGPTKMTTPAF